MQQCHYAVTVPEMEFFRVRCIEDLVKSVFLTENKYGKFTLSCKSMTQTYKYTHTENELDDLQMHSHNCIHF